MSGEMVPANGQPVQITMPDGTQAWVPPQYAGDIIRMMNGGGGRAGSGNLSTLIDVGVGVYEAFSADRVKGLAKKARKRRKELKVLQDKFELLSANTTVAELKTKLVEIFDKQAQVDRAQTEALEVGYKAMIASAVGAGGRVLANGARGGGGLGGLGSEAFLVGLSAFSVGALIFGTDDDEDDDE